MRVYASTLNLIKSRRGKSLRRYVEGGNLKCWFSDDEDLDMIADDDPEDYDEEDME